MDPKSLDVLETRKAELHNELSQIRRQIRTVQRKNQAKSQDVEQGRSPRKESWTTKCRNCCASKSGGSSGDEDEEDLETPLMSPAPTRHFGTKGAVSGAVVTNEADAEEIRSHFDYPSEFELVLLQMGMSLGYSAYLLTAWLYCGAVRHELFQDCTKTWHDPFMGFACETAALSFWTLPLFTCIILHVWYYRDLLCTRLYYEMLAHNVFLDFENQPFCQNSSIRVMLAWVCVAFLLYPLGAGNLMSIRGLKITASYWIPLASFIGGVLYVSWDLETRLLSLSKYVEREFDDAKLHIDDSLFIPDYVARQGFMAARLNIRRSSSFREGETTVAAAHTTGMYIGAIAQKATELETKGELLPPNDNDSLTGQSSLFAAFRSDYWVVNFLYCPHLDDARAVKFRTAFRIYRVYMFAVVGFLSYLFVSSCVSHLQHQGRIGESWITHIFQVERFLIMPIAQPPPA